MKSWGAESQQWYYIEKNPVELSIRNIIPSRVQLGMNIIVGVIFADFARIGNKPQQIYIHQSLLGG